MPPRAGLTREKIVDAAVLMVAREGLNALSLARLAQHFGVKAPSLYNHIEGSGGLRRAVRLRGVAELSTSLQQAVMGRSGKEALVSLAYAYREFARRNPGLYALTLEGSEGGDAELDEVANRILEVLLAVLRGYELHGVDAIHAIRILRSALHGFVTLESTRGFLLATDPEETFGRLVELLHDGLSGIN